jgi:hypothetical protein
MKISLLNLYISVFFISAMGAFAIGGVPVQWLGTIGVTMLFIIFPDKFIAANSLQPRLFIFFCLWTLFITMYQSVSTRFDWPADATTSFKRYGPIKYVLTEVIIR